MNLLSEHEHQWQQIKTAASKNRLPQSLLLAGSVNGVLASFSQRFTALTFCAEKLTEPCMRCFHCKMINNLEHPDLHLIKPDKLGGALKVEQIRQLQAQTYQTPQCADVQVFILHAAERMSPSVANALLKILEEPSSSTYFILLAEHLCLLLPTIISRCHILRFQHQTQKENLLTHVEANNQHITSILNHLIKLFRQETIPTMVAIEWKEFEFKDTLTLLYIIYAQLIHLFLRNNSASGEYSSELNQLQSMFKLTVLFEQLSKITALQKKIIHNRTINQSLALEDLLIHLIKS